MYCARIDSPFGPMLLRGGEQGLQGVYFTDQKDCPQLPHGPRARPDSLRPGSGRMNGVALRILRPARRLVMDEAVVGQMALFAADAPDNNDDRRARGTQDEEGAQNVQGGHGDGPFGKNSAREAGPLELLQNNTPPAVAGLFERVRDELSEYFLGTRKVFDLPLDLAGTPFQLKVWQALCRVPYGELVSYGQLAAMAALGRGHGRAVGAAVGRNPVSIIVPCHRIIGSNRTLTGYTGGLSRKVGLLQLEGFVFDRID